MNFSSKNLEIMHMAAENYSIILASISRLYEPSRIKAILQYSLNNIPLFRTLYYAQSSILHKLFCGE